jgi:hypothetical protein
MANERMWREDLTYAQEHRHALPEFFGRIGHRFHQADRDWTETCCACREPLLLVEEQHGGPGRRKPTDKGTGITRRLAERANVQAWQVVVYSDRPKAVQDEIDRLGRRISQLEAEYPITHFDARRIWRPSPARMIRLTPRQWWDWIALHHRHHHENGCRNPANHPPVKWARFNDALHNHPLHDGRLGLS